MTLAYERSGRGPTLILLHPLGADHRVWNPVVERLRDHRELVAVDLPGFGASPPLQRTPTPKALAETVAEWLRSIGIERPHVAGNSLGGWVGLELGLRGDASSVTAIAPAGLWPQPLMPKQNRAHNLARRLLPVIGAVASNPVGRRMLLGSAVGHARRVPARDAAHLVRAYGQAPGFIAVNEAMRAGTFGGLERIRVPITLVWPEYDRLINRPPWLPDNVRSVELRDAGHIPMWDAPEAVAEILLEATGGEPGGRGRGPAGRTSAPVLEPDAQT